MQNFPEVGSSNSPPILRDVDRYWGERFMDAFELLRKDHKKVAQLFKEIEAASGQSKKPIFSRLKSELDVHAHIEEKIFYPALENKEEARDITLEAYEEHKVVKDLLAELASGNAPEDEWDAKLTVLKENVEHHVEEEEGELFS
jgi:hemerythrin superfamily protein